MTGETQVSRMHLTPDQAARFGVRHDVESWRFELVLGLRDPVEYSAALKNVDARALFASLHLMDKVLRLAKLNVEMFVPLEMEVSFIDGICDLRERLLVEAARRGINLISEDPKQRAN